ncbi:hypothetical protein NS274_21975 [Pseudomonas oryzihabitans]|nr:hypothetical protein NS274_21975 [Pseudomonas psychrotolerans]KTT65201.1 hypothetical protein NS383_11730 [Pseudomonas psychrotolerans]
MSDRSPSLAIHQPAYLPWLGYFDRIARVDRFVFLDTVQFEKNSFINRNRIKTPQGVQWLTVPVFGRGHLNSDLSETRIDNSRDWRRDHLKALALNYRRTAHFDSRFARLEALYAEPEELLSAWCWRQLRFWLDELQIATPLLRASDLALQQRKSALVLEICQRLGAQHYLSGTLGRDYLDEAAFTDAGIRVEYQAFAPQPYPQLWGEFVAGLSIVDWWFNQPESSTPFRSQP